MVCVWEGWTLGQKRDITPSHAARAAAIAALSLAALLPATGCSGWQRTQTVQRDRPADLVNRAETVIQAGGTTEEALALLELAIEQNPELTVAHVRMGDVLLSSGRAAEAERSFRTAVRQDAQNFDAQFGLAESLAALGRVVESVRVYLRAVSLRPSDGGANAGLAAAYLELGEPAQSLPFARKAVESTPKSGSAWANLGAAHSLLGNHEDAVRAYESAAERMTLTPELLINWASSLGALMRYDEMATTLRAAININETAVARERLGYALFKMNALGEAEYEFRRSMELDDRHYPALNGLAVILLNRYLQSDSTQDAYRLEAIMLLRQSLQSEPDQPTFVELVRRFSQRG